MSMLARIQSGAPPMPPRIVLYAGEKWGKSSAGAFAPKPIFLMTTGETGLLSLIESGRVPPTPHFPEAQNWSDVWLAVAELRRQPHDYQTLVIDTGNGAEQLCARNICDESFGGEWSAYTSYGRGNEMASKRWSEFLVELDGLRADRKMQILILQHAKIKTFADPAGKDWDQWRPEAIEKCWALTHKWADAILFGGFKTKLDKDGKAQLGENRYLRAEASGPIIAGNRYGLPPELTAPAGAQNLWNAFAAALAKTKGTPAAANGAPTNGTPPPANGTPPKPAAKPWNDRTPEEKAEWFKGAIAGAHVPGKGRASGDEEIAYLTVKVAEQKFPPAIEEELRFALCMKLVSMAATLSRVIALDAEFGKLPPFTVAEHQDKLLAALNDQRALLAPPPEPVPVDPAGNPIEEECPF